jgi:hypothetical protein
MSRAENTPPHLTTIPPSRSKRHKNRGDARLLLLDVPGNFCSLVSEYQKYIDLVAASSLVAGQIDFC